MNRVLLKDLNMKSRNDVLIFLKRLWNNEETSCPICGGKLNIFHKKGKKTDNDWRCEKCNKIYKTLYLLDELNEEIPN